MSLAAGGATDACPPTTNYRRRAAVIGSGFGGLAAAIRLQSMGFDTVCYEAHDKPGGRAYVYEEQGYIFDAGPTVITAPFMLEELWGLAGRRLEDDIDLREVSPFYRIRFHDGSQFDYTGDAGAMAREIGRFAPASPV